MWPMTVIVKGPFLRQGSKVFGDQYKRNNFTNTKKVRDVFRLVQTLKM